MKMYDAIIIGAGPGGLFAALHLGKQGHNVLVLEKNASAGKKLLISGAGQCNLTHNGKIKNFFDHYGENHRFLKHALFQYTNEDTIQFFHDRGLKTIIDDNGKVFPETLKAQDILNILLDECKKNKVKILYNQPAVEVAYQKDRGFSVHTESSFYMVKTLIIAAGGKSYPSTGSTGEGYAFAKMFGHSIIEPKPSLTPLYISTYPFKELAGISFEDIPFAIWRNGKKIGAFSGDVLFTHQGISGPGILNHSRYMQQGDTITLNFLNRNDEDKFRKEFTEEIHKQGKIMVKTFLRKYPLPKRLIERLLELLEIPEEMQCANINKKTRNALITSLIAFPMNIDKLGGFHVAMATQGGVCLKEVNPKTMESRLIKGLYFAGEVLDIDGDTGGYNIQAAFSTGFLAGMSAGKKYK